MNKTSIDWPNLDYTWSPVVGCWRGCAYCWVRLRVWPRIRHLYGNNDFGIVTNLPDQDTKFDKIKKPSTIFVGPYTDICYWDDRQINHVLDLIDCYPQHTFMFLTKDPHVYTRFDWPKNTMQGITITGIEDRTEQTRRFMIAEECPRPFLSIEPLLGPIHNRVTPSVEIVIVGAMTGKDFIAPDRRWIDSVRFHCGSNIKIYFKKNIGKYL